MPNMLPGRLRQIAEAARSWSARQDVRRYLTWIAAFGPVLWLISPLRFRTPLSYDHSTHIFKAWHFWTEMLGQGRLRGWSNFWAFGFPSDELVPFGEELWVCLFRVLTLGLLSWTRTYALAIAALFLFKALAAFVFTRRFFGRVAAVLCTWFALFDPGAGLKGGWYWHTYFGVWPVELSMCFLVISFVLLDEVFERQRLRTVIWAALALCASLLSHQLGLFAVLVATPLLMLEHFFRPGPTPLRAYALALGAIGLGTALAAFSFVPFTVRSAHAQDLGWLGDSLPVIGQHLLELRTIENVWPPIHALALIGAWFALRERRRGAVFAACGAAAFLFLSSDTLVADLHLERALPILLKIETDRMLVVAKLFWFPLAGYGFAQLVSLPLRAEVALARGKRIFGWALTLIVAGVLIVPGLGPLYHEQIEKEFLGERQTQYWKDFQDFLAWSKTLERRPDEFYRVAYHFYYGNHLSTIAPAYNGLPMYKVGYTPTQIFDAFPVTDEPELFAALSIKYVLAGYPLERSDLTFERRFGELWLYRCNSYDPRPFHMEGAGQAELLEFSPERIRVRISHTDPQSRIVLHVANYDRWRATLAGKTLPIASVPVFAHDYPYLMEVPAADGELVVEYVYRTAEWLGLLITLAALPLFAGLVYIGRRSDVLERALDKLASWRWPILGGTLALLLVVGVVLALRTRDRHRIMPPESIFQSLDGSELTLDGQGCVKTEPLVFSCGDQTLRAEVVPGTWGLHTCMTTEATGELKIQGRVPLGSFLAGRYETTKEGSGSIQIAVNGTDLGKVDTRPARLRLQYIQFDTRPYAGSSPSVDFTVESAALHCFDLRRVP